MLCKDGSVKRFSLGAHTPDLSSADVERIHKLWVDAVKAVRPEIHHRDIVTAALSAPGTTFKVNAGRKCWSGFGPIVPLVKR